MSKTHKILHVVTALSWRGGEQQVAYLLEELKEKIQQVVLCSAGSKMEEYCQKNGHKHYTNTKGSGIDISYARKIKSICKKEAITLCHLHDAHAHTYAILAADLFANKADLILSRRVDFPIKQKWTSTYKYNHPKIKRILCVSKAILEISKKGIKDESKLYVVYSGIDTKKFAEKSGRLRKELQFNSEKFLVGNTSALADHKDYFTFIDACCLAKKEIEKMQVLVFGDGPMKEEITNYAKKSTIADSIHFLGFRSDVPQVLADLNVFFISSKTEGLGTSILDAFACALPVVATNAGGIPELVKNEVTGLLAPVGDVEKLASHLKLFSKETDLALKLGQNARKFVADFDKQKNCST